MAINGVTVLKYARDIISRHVWVKHKLACDLFGNAVGVSNPCAVGFCLIGAIRKAGHYTGVSFRCKKAAINTVYHVSRQLGFEDISKYNDHPSRIKQEVLDFFDKCITEARGKR